MGPGRRYLFLDEWISWAFNAGVRASRVKVAVERHEC
jgi:hypothetical protein